MQSIQAQIRDRSGFGGNARSTDQRREDQYNANTGSPMLAYNYSQSQNMGGQSPYLNRYSPPMFDQSGRPLNGQGGYAYNLPTNAGPYSGAFGQGQGAPMPQFGGSLQQYMQNLFQNQGQSPQAPIPAFGYQGQNPYSQQSQPTIQGMNPSQQQKGPVTTQGPQMDTGPQMMPQFRGMQNGLNNLPPQQGMGGVAGGGPYSNPGAGAQAQATSGLLDRLRQRQAIPSRFQQRTENMDPMALVQGLPSFQGLGG